MDSTTVAIGSAFIAAIAALIAVCQAISARSQAREAKRQADAAEDSNKTAQEQVIIAKRQLTLAQEQRDDQQRDRDEQAIAQAKKVLASMWRNQRLSVKIDNFSTGHISQVVLLGIDVRNQPGVSWICGAASGGNMVEHVPPEGSFQFRGGFLDADGAVLPAPSADHADYSISFAFTDAAGQRWRRSGTSTPRRIIESADEN